MSARRYRKRLMSEINVVPYIDVMLVLLVIFMITAPLLTEGVRIDMVEAGARAIDTPDDEPFVVTVDAQGNYYALGADQTVTLEDVRAKAAAVLRHRPRTDFLVRGDRAASYEQVVQAMVALQQAGVQSVGLVTESPEPGLAR